MAAGFKVAGPCRWFVGTGASAAMEFLAFCEGETSVSLDAEFEDVYCDFGGRVPVDSIFMGEQAYISGTLSYYDETVLQKCLRRLPKATLNLTPGAVADGSVGTLMISEGAAIQLILTSPYATKQYMTSQGMVAGYRFPASWIPGSANLPLGNTLKRPRIMFRALPVWTPASNSAILYDHNMTSLPA